jgi:hypothetical protein
MSEFGAWGVDALMSVNALRGKSQQQPKGKGDLRDQLNKVYATVRMAQVPETPKSPSAIRYTLSPFDPDVDQDAFLSGEKRRPPPGAKGRK